MKTPAADQHYYVQEKDLMRTPTKIPSLNFSSPVVELHPKINYKCLGVTYDDTGEYIILHPFIKRSEDFIQKLFSFRHT